MNQFYLFFELEYFLRRPRTAGTDSDHGYSTMTPGGDQDSEIMSCLGDVPSHPRRMRHKNPLSLQSVTSGTSSRTSSPVHGKAPTLVRKAPNANNYENIVDFLVLFNSNRSYAFPRVSIREHFLYFLIKSFEIKNDIFWRVNSYYQY